MLPRLRKPDSKQIEQYDHKDKKRCNNPPLGWSPPKPNKDEMNQEVVMQKARKLRQEL